MRPRGRELLTGDIEWARHYLAPWLGKGIRRLRTGYGIERKRPDSSSPAEVEKSLRPICASLRRRGPGRRTRLGRSRWDREERRAGVLEVLAQPVAESEFHLDRDEVGARVADVGEEEQPGVQPAQAVAAVDEVVAAAQHPGAAVVVGCTSRTCASVATSGSPSLPLTSKSGWLNSLPPDSGAPSALVRPMTRSCSLSGCRSQISMVMLIRRATR